MKPTPVITPNQRFSRSDRTAHRSGQTFQALDCSYHLPVEAVEASSAVMEQRRSEVRSFRKISRDFFGVEAGREFFREALFFASMLGVATWPLGVMLQQLTQWMISPPPGGIW